jgi:hypothetical protein
LILQRKNNLLNQKNNNEIVFAVSGSDVHIADYKKFNLTVGTYTIAMNGVAIHYFDGKVIE